MEEQSAIESFINVRREGPNQHRRNDITKQKVLSTGVFGYFTAEHMMYPFHAQQHVVMTFTPNELAEAIRIQQQNGLHANLHYAFTRGPAYP